MAITLSKSTLLISEFVAHVVVGAFGFFIIFAAVVALTAFTIFVEEKKLAPDFAIFLMHHLEEGILIIDIIGFAAILIAELYKLLAKVYDSIKPMTPTTVTTVVATPTTAPLKTS